MMSHTCAQLLAAAANPSTGDLPVSGMRARLAVAPPELVYDEAVPYDKNDYQRHREYLRTRREKFRMIRK